MKAPRMLFIISSPRSGSTMLERILESHSQILGGPEPHLITPLAHLGVWDKVDKAPYDHILAAESQKHFVDRLPHKKQDYWEACRAYCDVLYGRLMEGRAETVCLDKTPAYALVLPFMMKVLPDAKYVVLTRHPVATFSSYANSFFDGDYHAAQTYNPILTRYVPELARFIRQTEVPAFHVRYEDLVQDSEAWMQKIYSYIGVPFEGNTINYGEHERDDVAAEGLGDPIGVDQHSRPTAASVDKWVQELAADASKREYMQKVVAQVDPTDLHTLGYSLSGLWEPLEAVRGQQIAPPSQKLSRYRLQRKAIVKLRGLTQKSRVVRKGLAKVRLACDVLLRE